MGRKPSRSKSSGPTAASAGGRGNEAGSVFRAGVGAYLAAHGLAGRGVEAAGYPENAAAPVQVSFETGEAVDDIRCELADGTVLRFQAKRACGVDQHLTATVAQWAGQVDDLRPGDMMGLVTAEAKGHVRSLGEALERRRRSVPGRHTANEVKAIEAVNERMPAGTSDEAAERVLRTAFVMTVTVSSSREEGYRSAANLLDGRIVAPGSGSAAFSALQSAFWKQAKAGTGSDLDDWLQVLEEANLPVLADAEGTPGGRRRAELDAVTAHRARLASRNGVLEYSLLADDLPPMIYEPLAESLRVSVPTPPSRESVEFLVLARRWRRMLLTGLPGMGKSTALAQAAARLAAQSDAPVPLIVPLREIARRNPRSGAEVTVAVLIEAATAEVADSEQLTLRRALQRAVESGDAVLLLDGLDECRDRKAVVADGLSTALNCLPPSTGVILTTRDSGLAAAERLNMPEARLAEPSDMAAVLTALLRHAAQRFPAADRDLWVSQREQQLGEVRREHTELFSIPLFAVLVTLLLAQPARRALPRGRAQLLAAAVHDTVQQWEVKRLSEDPPGPHASADQIMDGYAAISHAYTSNPGGCDLRHAVGQVKAMLREQWGMSEGEARERSRYIAWFWDEHVGVFTSSLEGDEIQARSRVFAEIGEALWAESRSPEDLRAWITSALSDDECREQVILACGLSGDITDELIESARRTTSSAIRMRALLWAADGVADDAEPSSESLAFLMDQLTEAARQEGAPDNRSAGQPERPGWQYILRLAMLILPAAQRAHGQELISELVVGDYEHALAAGLAALTDAKGDSSRILESGQAAFVKALLALPLPAQSRSGRSSAHPGGYEVSGDTLLPGHQEAARQAVQYMPQLGKEAADSIYLITYHGWFQDFERVSNRLASLGFQPPEQTSVGPKITEMLARAGIAGIDDVRDIWQKFFEAASTLAPHRPLSDCERWRYPGIATLASLMFAPHAKLRSVITALTNEQSTLRDCMLATAHAADLDATGIAAEATLSLEACTSGNRDVVAIMLAPQSVRPTMDAGRLDSKDKNALINALGARSDWLTDIARNRLLGAHDPHVAGRAASKAQALPASKRVGAIMVAIANTPDPVEAASQFLNSGDSRVRAAAVTAIREITRRAVVGPWIGMLNGLLTTDDKVMRQALRADAEANPKEITWSCRKCGYDNGRDASCCTKCGDRSPIHIFTINEDPDQDNDL